jgi:transposase
MSLFLHSFSKSLERDEHAILILDNASWHRNQVTNAPKNITLHFLPPYSPELNPVERLWLFIKTHYLCNKLYKSLEYIMDTGVKACKLLTAEIVRSVCASKLATS